jgi:hypothetical protein
MIIDFGKLGKFPYRLALVVVVDSPQDPEDKYQLVVQSTTEEMKHPVEGVEVVSNIPPCILQHHC